MSTLPKHCNTECLTVNIGNKKSLTFTFIGTIISTKKGVVSIHMSVVQVVNTGKPGLHVPTGYNETFIIFDDKSLVFYFVTN